MAFPRKNISRVFIKKPIIKLQQMIDMIQGYHFNSGQYDQMIKMFGYYTG